MPTYIQRQNQQANRWHIKITYLLTAPQPARGNILCSILPWESVSCVQERITPEVGDFPRCRQYSELLSLLTTMVGRQK